MWAFPQLLGRNTKHYSSAEIARRTHRSGIVETNSEIEELLHAIALHLDLQGSINVQLRLRAGIPYVFEINPRFSSTVRFRYKLGFSDVIWSMQDSLHRVVDSYQMPMIGTRFYKIYEDVIG